MYTLVDGVSNRKSPGGGHSYNRFVHSHESYESVGRLTAPHREKFKHSLREMAGVEPAKGLLGGGPILLLKQ